MAQDKLLARFGVPADARTYPDICLHAGLLLLQATHPLVVEGAGGVLVPISETLSMADLFSHWGQPVILCARTALGTINHSLLSVEALRSRGVSTGTLSRYSADTCDARAT